MEGVLPADDPYNPWPERVQYAWEKSCDGWAQQKINSWTRVPASKLLSAGHRTGSLFGGHSEATSCSRRSGTSRWSWCMTSMTERSIVHSRLISRQISQVKKFPSNETVWGIALSWNRKHRWFVSGEGFFSNDVPLGMHTPPCTPLDYRTMMPAAVKPCSVYAFWFHPSDTFYEPGSSSWTGFGRWRFVAVAAATRSAIPPWRLTHYPTGSHIKAPCAG